MAISSHQAAELETWPELRQSRKWPTLLVGNGASINLWGDFAYQSLFRQADLSSAATAVFADLETINFEMALEAIHHAHVVVEALKNPTEAIDSQYEHVRDSLFDAVRAAHVDWSLFTPERFQQVASVIQDHAFVYTTNYDLCLYWSRMAASETTKRPVIDFFWGPDCTFDPESVELRDRIATYYLHGAVHLWQNDRGVNGKWTSANRGNLLSLSDNYSPDGSKLPLFVSEGSSKAKLQMIERSPYLKFCLNSLQADNQNTVIFGHALGEQDNHIVTALNQGDPREIAVSLRPAGSHLRIIKEKARLTELLGDNAVTFFDSTSHPLGATSLTIPEDATAR